jgi:hypothetical protein
LDTDDPYEGGALPVPPEWLPEASEAVSTARESRRAARAAESADSAASAAPRPVLDTGGDFDDASGADADDEPWEYIPLGISDPEAPDEAPDFAAPTTETPALEAPGYAPPAGLPGQNWFEDDRPRRPWMLIAAVGVSAVLLVVLAVVIDLGGGGSGNKNRAATQQSRASAPAQPPASDAATAPEPAQTGPVAARPVPADQLAALRPQSVAVGTYNGQLQVSWDPPRQPQAVSGYFVIAQTPDGHIKDRKLVEKDADRSVVFDDPSLCAVVTTVVGTPQGLQLARGDLVCPATRPSSDATGG